MVDAVEGMCARTHQVLREAHVNQLVPILVINKVDRLCTDLCLTSTEAYLRLRNLIENVNAASAAMLTSSRHHSQNNTSYGEVFTKNNDTPSSNSTNGSSNIKQQQEYEEEEDALWTFEPMKGNVIFASALFGWGFTVPSLARSLFRSKALPLKPLVLKQWLFGDFKYKNDKVLKWKTETQDEMPLFAEFALQPLWEIYEGVAAATAALGLSSDLFTDGRASLLSSSTGTASNNNKQGNSNDSKITSTTPGMETVLSAMQSGGTGPQIPQTPADIQTILTQTGSSSEESVLRSLLRRYRPLSDVVLDTIYEICPSPATAASIVRPRALAFCNLETPTDYFTRMQEAAKACDPSPECPTVAHVCKFMGVDRRHVRDPGLDAIISSGNSEGEEDNNLILGLARVLCGTLKTKSEYYALGPKHKAGADTPRKQIRLYLLMGSEFVLVDEVPAGHLCAVYNLEDVQLKTVTLCDQPDGMPLQGFDRGVRPLVKVNVEAVDAADTDFLERGLLQLSLADAAVEVTATAKGERILACLGEIHLEQSILDLQKVYCRKKDIQLRVSDPIVEFAETTDWFVDKQEDTDYQSFFDDLSPRVRQTTIPPYNEEEGLAHARHGRTRAVVSGRCAAISLRVVPLASSVYQALQQQQIVGEECEEELLRLGRALQCFDRGDDEHGSKMKADTVLSMLVDSMRSIDGNGNVMIESCNLASGYTAIAVESETGQIHIPSTVTTDAAEAENGAGAENQNEDGMVVNSCSDEYEVLRNRVRQVGLFPVAATSKANNISTSPPDAVALAVWKNNLSSAIAGFQLALRAGPICEEPVRSVMVVLEGFEVAVTKKKSDNEYESAKAVSSGMVMSAIRSGVRCCLL